MISVNLKKRLYTSSLLSILIFLIIKFDLILMYSLIVLGVLSILEFFSIVKKITKNKFTIIFFNSLFLIYVFIFCFLFYFLSNFMHLKIIIFSLLLGCVFSDIGGYVFGKIFKGPKLTKISPNKTFSGALGSLFLTSLIFSGLMLYFTKNFIYEILIISIITSIACQLGDLFFSYLKRKAKIKNTGNFFPGHGGALDRLDGIFLGVPCGFLSLIFLF
jgi:phosphatidate cytidylyltransferase